MSQTTPPENQASLVLPVYPAEGIRVCDGVNHGDPLSDPAILCTGDTYRLPHEAQPLSLVLDDTQDPQAPRPVFTVSGSSEVEGAGVTASVTARLTFMTAIGALVEGLLVACGTPAHRVYFHPLGPMEPGTEYTLIASEPDPTRIPLTDLTAMCFGRGTRITMSDGMQRPVEALKVGDRVLTRDNGMKPILWLGKRTVQAVGSFAPVVITPGVLGNAENVTVAQHHRILISDWRAEVMVGARDVLIQSKELVNGETVFIRSGGFVEYTQLVLDAHQVIYAEGIPSESLRMSDQILASLPKDVAASLRRVLPHPGADAPQHQRVPLDGELAASLLRQTGRF
ncbi:MAG: Hint domain-containing protein [Pseudomonadota bacterium]